MQTKDEPRFAPAANQDSSLGVRLLKPRTGRPNPFGVQWGERIWDEALGRDRRKVRTEFFPTAAGAAARAAELRSDRKAGAARTITRREIADWKAFSAATSGTPWQEVVAGWRAHLQAHGLTPCSTTVGTHVKDYLAELKRRVKDNGATMGTYRHHKHKLGLFAEQFGHLTLGQVKAADVRKWLDGRDLEVAATWNNYRKILRVCFELAVSQSLIGENPVDRIDARPVAQREHDILTVPQIAQLLHTALTAIDAAGRLRFKRGLWRLVLEVFAGVRYSSACRLRAVDVNEQDRGIRHPAHTIKTRRRQYIEGYPDVLWEWLKVAEPCDDLPERQYLELKSELFRTAQVPHPRNCLRHSFPTYHLASRTNPGLTAYLLCHRNQQRLWDTYKGNATAAEGHRFEALRPQTVAAVAQEWMDALHGRETRKVVPLPVPA